MSGWLLAHPWGAGLIGAFCAAVGVFFLKLAERRRPSTTRR